MSFGTFSKMNLRSRGKTCIFFLDSNCLETFTSADGVNIIIKDFSDARLPDQIFVFLWTQRVYQVNPGKRIMFFGGGIFCKCSKS